MNNGDIIAKRAYPSPSSKVKLYEITYWSEGSKVKGLLAIPCEATAAMLYLRGDRKSVV